MSSETFEFGVGQVDDIESHQQQQQQPQPQPPLIQSVVQQQPQQPPNDDASSVSSEGINNKFIIDNLSPTWGIMLTVQDNLNLRIGLQLKKKYFNAGFWNYISTPINFTITLFTALSAGQTGSGSNFLNQSQLFYVLLSTFVLSIVNTFFKLREKADINYTSAKMWEQYAAVFEEIYFTPINKNEDVSDRLERYNSLISKINKEYVEETVEYVNYITELFFYFFRLCRIYKDYRYLGIKRRHWILDGASSRFYKENLDYYRDRDDGACFKVYDIDETIFRKDLNKEVKREERINRYYFF
jgi:hypothetical protein